MDTRDLQLAQTRTPRPSERAPSVLIATGLSLLTPSSLLPESYSRHMQRITKFKQVRVSVHAHNGDEHYAVEVHTSPRIQTNIPTSHVFATNAFGGSDPEVVVGKTFGDFIKLRDDLYSCSKTSHVDKNCEFCNEVAKCLRPGFLQTGSLNTLAFSKEKRARVLDDFIGALVRIAISCPIEVRHTCRCQEHVPRQLYNFLFEVPDMTSPNGS